MKQLGAFILLPVATYLLLCLYLYFIQRSMLYFPTPPSSVQSEESFLLTNGEHTLKILTLRRGSKKALIYFGGNAEDVAGSQPSLSILFPEHDLYIVNYRGYGGSTGSPSEEALFDDALLLHEAIGDNYTEIVAMGRSLGTGVALHLAAKREIGKLILVTPYDSMVNVARHHYSFLPVSMLLKDRYDSIGLANHIDIPTLMLIAERDEVIPRANSDTLAAQLHHTQTRTIIIPGTGHNDIDLSPQYGKAIHQFLQQ